MVRGVTGGESKEDAMRSSEVRLRVGGVKDCRTHFRLGVCPFFSGD